LRLSRSTLAHWPSAVAHDMVGLSLAAVGDHEGAVRELRQAVDEYPPARYDLAVALLATGRMDEAVEELKRFVAHEPNLFTTSAARTLLGRAFAAQGRVSDAIAAFQLAVTGPAPDPQAHGPLADLLLDAQRYDEAITHYRAYLAAFPERASAMANLGIALASAHRTDDALAVFRHAVQVEPANVAARENLARMLLEAGQVQAAAAEAQTAVSIAPTRPAAYDLLGQALAAERRFEDARLAFEQALRFDPNYAPAREHLRRLGR
jgi:Flp pilus assembly protein TadD